MKKEKTLQEVQEKISELQEERKKYDVKLKQLQNQGKKVGVISHVQEMVERIAVKVVVQKKGNGKSSIVVTVQLLEGKKTTSKILLQFLPVMKKV